MAPASASDFLSKPPNTSVSSGGVPAAETLDRGDTVATIGVPAAEPTLQDRDEFTGFEFDYSVNFR